MCLENLHRKVSESPDQMSEPLQLSQFNVNAVVLL